MRILLGVGLVIFAFGCGITPSPEAVRSGERALSVSNIRTVAPSTTVGLAEEQQRDPDIVAGPAGEQLVVWEDQRNFRLHASDIYAALIRDGGVVHPLGVPIATGPGNEDEPHVGFDGVAYTVAWSERGSRVFRARFGSPTDAFEPRLVSLDSRRPRVAAGGGYTLVMYRRNIGLPEGVLVGPDGGVQTLRDGGTTLTFGTTLYYQGALAAEWSPAYGAFLIAIGDNVQGLYLARLDPHPLDGGLPLPDAPVLISSQPFPTDTYFTSGVELATSPGGHIGVAWRVGSDSYVAVMQTVPQANFPQGTSIETATSGAPSISWTGSKFRVAVTSSAASRLLDLSLGGIPNEVATGAAFPSANDCQSCPPVVLEGQTIVRTVMNGAPFGPDLTIEQRDEIGTTIGLTTITQSASASHAPSAAWSSDGGLLLVWSSADDGGLVRHDVRYRRYSPFVGLMSAPVALAPNSSRDDSYPRVQWSLGRWWVATAGPTSVTSGSANIYTATDTLAFANSLSQPSNGPAALADGWVVASDIDRCEVRRLVSDGTLGSLAEGPYTSAWFPEIAVDSAGNPMVVSVSRPGAFETVDVSANGVGGPRLTTNAGEPRAAVIASDGTLFAAVYTERDSQQMTLRRQDLRLLSDAGIELVGPVVELARAQFIELPSIAFARGQYLVTWSERESVTAPSQAKLRTLKPDGGSGVLVPLDLGVDGGHDVGVRLAIAPGEATALVTWTRLDAPGLGVPTAYLATMNVGLAQGQSCASGGECSTGSCVNNVCCNEACNTGCGECNVAGVCVPKAFNVTCQPATECTEAAFCDSVSLTCPLQPAANEGSACGDGGVCAAGVCLTRDAGTVSSTDGGGARDAGITDEGVADAGLSDAGTVDGGTNISHYSWTQGCSTTESALLPLVLMILAWRDRRIRRARVVTPLLLSVLLLPFAVRAEEKSARLKLVFPGITAGAGARTDDAVALSEFLQTKLVGLGIYDVTGGSDIVALLGFERQKALAGCDDTSCGVDLAGALNSDRLLNGNLSKLGDSWLLTLALYDAKTNTPIHRASERFSGSLDRALDALDPLLKSVLDRDTSGLAAANVSAVEGSSSAAPSHHEWTVGVKLDADVIGLAARQLAIAPALSGSWGYGIWGAALTVIFVPIPGVRAEGRIHLLEGRMIRPLAAVGLTVFGAAVAPRGALGVSLDVGPVRVALDVGVEYFVSGAARYAPLSIVAGLGASWRF